MTTTDISVSLVLSPAAFLHRVESETLLAEPPLSAADEEEVEFDEVDDLDEIEAADEDEFYMNYADSIDIGADRFWE